MAADIVMPINATGTKSYVEWGAVIAGAIAADAVALVLLTFGSAIGLTALSPWTATSTSLKAVGLGAAVWFLFVTLWSFAMGGYLAGRLRHKWNDAALSEIQFRDGAHGLLVWALAVLLGAFLAASGVSAIGGGLLTAAKDAPSAFDPTGVATDTLLRNTKPGQTISPEVRNEVSRILIRSGKRGEVAQDDRTYLASVVAANTGIPQADAEKRVDDAIATMKDALDRARKLGVLFGFLTGAILLVGAATAWWAAKEGGKHRDEGTVWSGLS
jgi:hypothetical protein